MPNVTPTVLSMMIQAQMLDSGRVFPRVLTDLKANLALGSSVKISGIGDITVRSGSSAVTTESPSNYDQLVTIDQDKYFSIELTDKQQAQSMIKMAQYSAKAANALANDLDKTIATLASSAQKTIGSNATVVGATEISAYLNQIFAYLRSNSDSEFVPDLFVGPYLARVIKEAYENKSTDNDASLKRGFIGNYLGFDVIETTSVVSSGSYAESGSTLVETAFAAITKDAVGVAMQNSMEAETLRGESSFKTIYRGRMLYGAKIINEKKFCSFICKPDLSD